MGAQRPRGGRYGAALRISDERKENHMKTEIEITVEDSTLIGAEAKAHAAIKEFLKEEDDSVPHYKITLCQAEPALRLTRLTEIIGSWVCEFKAECYDAKA
jgi:hypothetical protein